MRETAYAVHDPAAARNRRKMDPRKMLAPAGTPVGGLSESGHRLNTSVWIVKHQ